MTNLSPNNYQGPNNSANRLRGEATKVADYLFASALPFLRSEEKLNYIWHWYEDWKTHTCRKHIGTYMPGGYVVEHGFMQYM